MKKMIQYEFGHCCKCGKDTGKERYYFKDDKTGDQYHIVTCSVCGKEEWHKLPQAK